SVVRPAAQRYRANRSRSGHGAHDPLTRRRQVARGAPRSRTLPGAVSSGNARTQGQLLPPRTPQPRNADAGFVPGHPLPAWHRMMSWLLRGFQFGRVVVSGARERPSALRGGRLVLASHRNGAIDGYQVLRAFPGIQFLASVQLLRNRFLRLMFTGIPVVRGKDRARYGIERAAFDDPGAAACAHLRAGGAIAVFPEGTSEWGHRPQPYRAGAARIARVLADEGFDLEVVPVGLFYSAPDRFRSLAEVRVGAPVALPA